MASLPTVVHDNTKIVNNGDLQGNNTTQENNDPIVINPDSDSENDLEFSDAIEANDKSSIKDELTDIKNKKNRHNNKVLETEPDSEALSEDDDFFKDAEDLEASEKELDETETSELKKDEIKKEKRRKIDYPMKSNRNVARNRLT